MIRKDILEMHNPIIISINLLYSIEELISTRFVLLERRQYKIFINSPDVPPGKIPDQN
jgi:hypothetical protein